MQRSRLTSPILRSALDCQWLLQDERHQYARRLTHFVVRMVFATIVCALFYSVIASAQTSRPLQSLEAIRVAAENYVRENARTALDPSAQLLVKAQDPDPRLQLPVCQSQLQAFTLNNAALGARNIVAVRCTDADAPGWTVYIPTLVEIEKEILVMRRSVLRDAHVAADDVELSRRRVPGLGSNYVSDLNSLREQHLKRGVPAGSPLTSDALARDLLVKRGQEVSLIFGNGGIAVKATGVALADGGLADRIRVQNSTSLKVVEGTIESGNLVRVGL